MKVESVEGDMDVQGSLRKTGTTRSNITPIWMMLFGSNCVTIPTLPQYPHRSVNLDDANASTLRANQS